MILAVLSLLPALWSPVLPVTLSHAPVTQAQEVKPKPCTPEIEKLIDAALAEKELKVKIEKLQATVAAARASKDRQGEGSALQELGEAKWSQYERSCLDDFSAAARIFAETGDDRRRSWVLTWLGYVSSALGDQKTALAKYEEALPLLRKCGDINGEADTFLNLGNAYSALGDPKSALAKYEEALPLYRRCGAISGEATTLVNIGFAYSALGDPKAALVKFEEALPLSRKCGNILLEASTLTAIGSVYSILGDNNGALAKYEEALPLHRKCGDIPGEATTLNYIGNVCSVLGEKKRALARYEEALLLFRKCGNASGEASALANIGVVYAELGDKQTALAKYADALLLFRKCGDISDEAVTLNNIGGVHSDLGDKKSALARYQEALPLYRRSGDILGEATTLSNIGGVYSDLGEKKAALATLEEALPSLRKSGAIRQQGKTLTQIGAVYSDLGDKKAALAQFEEALLLFRKCGDIRGEAITLNNIGAVYDALGDKRGALAKYEEALLLWRKSGDISGEAHTLNNIGLVCWSLGDRTAALTKYEAALSLHRTCGDIRGEATTLNNMGAVYANLGNHKAAMSKFEEALPLWRIGGDIRGEANTLKLIGLLLDDPANLAPATIFGKLSVNLTQQLRANAPENLLATFTSTVEHSYVSLADSLARQERFAESLKVANMLKGTELYGYTRRDEGASSILKERIPLTKREAAWIGGYEKIGTSLGEMGAEHEKLRKLGEKNRDADQEKRFQELTVLLSKKQEEFQAYVKNALTQFAKPERPEGIASVESLNSDLLELKDATGQTAVALNYALAEKSGSVILSLPGAAPKGAAIDKTREEINKKALALWQKLQDPTSDPIPEASELYDLLIRPVEKDFPKDTKVLMLSLQSGLLYVPFAALYDKETKQWLGEKYQSVIFTTKSRSRWNLDPKKDGAVVALGSSKARKAKTPGEERTLSFNALPGVPEEAHAADPNALLDEKFDRAAWEKVLTDRGRSTIHLATHCQLGSDNASTFILLGDGTLFALSELKDEKSSLSFAGVDLLVLSACQTAVGDGDGTELEGFAAVCEMKGARAVLASQWKVDDTATQRLMKRFYALRKQHQDWTKLACLNQATKDLRDGKLGAKGDAQDRSVSVQPAPRTGSKWKGAAWAHPYYWAPFVLFGNWK